MRKIINKIWTKSVILISSSLLKAIVFLILIALFVSAVFWLNQDNAVQILDFIESALLPITLVLFIITFKENIAKFIDDVIEATILGNKFKRQPSPVKQDISKNPQKFEQISESEKIKEEYASKFDELKNNAEKLRGELVKTSIYLDFERIYRTIFGSQLLLLRILKNNKEINNLEYSSQNMENYFIFTKKNWPLNLQSWTTNLYLRFLMNNQLINYDQAKDRYTITNKGIALLSYIDLAGYNDIKPL